MRRKAGSRENFFIAKNGDSGSAPAGFQPISMTCNDIDRVSIVGLQIAKTPAAQSLPAISTIANVAFSRAARIIMRVNCCVAGERAPRTATLLHQHFLKRDAVFSSVLVYSGCSASRFPSARSD
jgi:hypothetical protein